MEHGLGIDVESWALNPAFRRLTPEERKRVDADAVPRQVDRLLHLLDCARQQATWFISTEVYEWYPASIEAIAREGHEVAYHTHTHPEPITGPVLQEELQASRAFLARFHPIGFRAPRMFMPPEVYPVLRQAGFQYSSSVYGDASRPYAQEGITELPVSSAPHWGRPRGPEPHGLTLPFVCREFPYGSGVALGLMDGRLVAWYIRRQARLGIRSNLFVHVWQQPPWPPALRRVQWRAVVRSGGLLGPYLWDTTRSLRYVMDRFRFRPCRDLVAHP